MYICKARELYGEELDDGSESFRYLTGELKTNSENQYTINDIIIKPDTITPITVRKFSLSEFEDLYKKVNEYLENGDGAYPINDTVEISIYSDGKINISADFKSYHSEDITL